MKLSRTAYIIVVVLANFGLDQISKLLVRLNVEEYSVSPIIGDFFTLRHVYNEGAFLGMGSKLEGPLRILLLNMLPLLVLGYVMWYVFRDKSIDRLSLFGYCAIVGGGFANILDRILFGKVTDFLHIDLGGVFQTGVFNFADMSVSFGLILILWASIRHRKKKRVEA